MATKKTRKRTTKNAVAKKAPAKKVRAGRDGGSNKSDFIRAQPASMSAKEVIAAAKAEGLELTPSLVYNVRGRGGGKAKGPSKRGPGRPKQVGPASDEVAFRKLVVRLGTARARALVAEVEEKLAAVIAGR